jgi:hypothetical protein
MLQRLSQSINHRTIRRCIVRLLTASLNRKQVKGRVGRKDFIEIIKGFELGCVLWTLLINAKESRDISVGITIGYGLDRRGSIPCRRKILLYSVQTGSGAHPISLSLGVKRPEHEADSPPQSVLRPRMMEL